MKAVKAKKHAKMRKPQVKKTVEGMQIVHLEKEDSDGDSGGMLDTRNMYQVCFCYTSARVFFIFAALV